MSAKVITPVDFQGFMDALKPLMKGDSRFKDFDFEASGMASIIRLLATVSSTQALNSHLTLAESHTSTSELLENVQALITPESGYVPLGNRSARISSTIVVTPSDALLAPLTADITPSFSATGYVDGSGYDFQVVGTHVAPLLDGVYTFENVVMKEGQLVTSSFKKSGSGLETFEIPNKGIDISTLKVVVRNSFSDKTDNSYSRFKSTFDLGPDELIYFISMNRRGFYQIEFGDGFISKGLGEGNIIYVSYHTSSGISGNGVEKLVASSEVSGYSNIKVTPISKSSDGADPEDIDTVKRRSNIAYGMEGVAVSGDQYAEVLGGLFSGREVTQWGGEVNIPPKPGFVMLSVHPSLTEEEKIEGSLYVKKFSVGSIYNQIIDASYYTLLLDVTIGASSSLNSEIRRVQNSAKVAISDFITTISKFKATFDPFDLQTFIDDRVTGIDRVYVKYSISKVPDINRKSMSVSYHRQIMKNTFNVTVYGSLDFDTIKEVGGVMGFYKGDTLYGVLPASVNYADGNVDVSIVDGSLDFITFGSAFVEPDGNDLIVKTERNEVFSPVLRSLEVGI